MLFSPPNDPYTMSNTPALINIILQHVLLSQVTLYHNIFSRDSTPVFTAQFSLPQTSDPASKNRTTAEPASVSISNALLILVRKLLGLPRPPLVMPWMAWWCWSRNGQRTVEICLLMLWELVVRNNKHTSVKQQVAMPSCQFHSAVCV